jgi:hypothetical protein
VRLVSASVTLARVLQSIWRYRRGLRDTAQWSSGCLDIQYRPVSTVSGFRVFVLLCCCVVALGGGWE